MLRTECMTKLSAYDRYSLYILIADIVNFVKTFDRLSYLKYSKFNVIFQNFLIIK
jgi:hypothetical protein